MSRCAAAFRTAAFLALLGIQGVFGGETYMSIVPVGTGPNGELAPGVVIDGSAITLSTDGTNAVPVFLEIRIGDWDPNDTGTTLRGYQPHFESSSLTSGASGAIGFYTGSTSCGQCSDNASPCFSRTECTPGACSGTGGPCYGNYSIYQLDNCPSDEFCVGDATCDAIASPNGACSDNGDPCFDAQDCTAGTCNNSGAACHGPVNVSDCAQSDFCVGAAICEKIDVCDAELGKGSSCGPPAYFLGGGTCAFAFTDRNRPDWVLADAGSALLHLDVSSPDVRPSATSFNDRLHDPEPFPEEGFYGATLALLVPPDAQGTFTISLKPEPFSILTSGAGPNISPLDVIPAQIRVNPGRCYFNLDLTPFGRDRCVDGLTQNECAAQNGVTFFEAGGTCADLRPAVCGDNLMNRFSEECDGTDDAACAGICLGDCTCNPTCGDVDGDGNADMLGVAIFMNCFTGPDAGPVTPECQCAKFDTDDDIDLDDLFGFLQHAERPVVAR